MTKPSLKIFFVLLLASVLVFPHFSFATSWNAVVDQTFAQSNTSTGSAGSTTGVGNGWTDTAGGVWNISSNLLQGTSSASSDYLTKFLLRPSSEDSRDEREVATIPAGENFNGQYLGLVLRHQTGTNNYYLAHISGTGIYLYKIVGGTTTLLTSDLLTINTSDSYTVDFSAVGINSTALSVVVTDVTTSTTVGTISTSDVTASLQGSGSIGLTTWYNSGAHAIHASRIQTFTTNLVLTGTSSFSGSSGSAVPITDLQIEGSSGSNVPVKLLTTSGTLAMSTMTGLTFTGPTTGSSLYFTGSLANDNAALATLTYTRSGAGTDTLEVSLVNPGEVFFPDNGHLYKFITGSIDWNTAETAAIGQTAYGVNGYLATITSQAENDFISPRLSADGWIGASDNASEGQWTWVTGPETGTLFWVGEAAGSLVPGQYANWNTGEPNNSPPSENCAEYYSGSSKWNDLPCSGDDLGGYVAEFGAPGNLPSVTAKDISLTTSVSYSLAYAAGAHGSLTGSTSQTVLGGNSGTAVTAVPAAGYSFINWSDSSTQNPRTDTSVAGNISVTANFADITAPSVPGTPVASASNTVTPTWTWTPSTDAGSGMQQYFLKWSNSSDCNSGSNTGIGPSSPSYAIPSGGAQMNDGTWYFCVAAQDLAGNVSAYSPAGTVTTDTIPPTVSNVATAPSLASGVITWTTTEPASSIVTYGTSPSYATPPNGTTTAEADISPRVTSHSVTLTGLTCGTTYYFNVESNDAATNSGGSTMTHLFTSACPVAVQTFVHRNNGTTVTPTAVDSVSGSVSHEPLDFSVNDGAKTTSSPALSLLMNADPGTVKGYAVSLDPTFTNDGISTYTGPTTTFTLPDISGKYTVYLQYYSTTGKTSALLSKTIMYEKNGPATPTTVSWDRTLRFGSTGRDVTSLQQFLNTHGFPVAKTGTGSLGHESNVFGTKVLAAVKLYQKAHGISPVSGIVGPMTLAVMNS